MPRIYKRRPDALRDKLTVPMSPDLLRRLREFADASAQTPTTMARHLIEKALPAESVK
jgi:predicted transcriptional regulator